MTTRYLSSRVMTVIRSNSFFACCKSCINAVAGIYLTRIPCSIKCSPSAAATCDLPTPEGPINKRLFAWCAHWVSSRSAMAFFWTTSGMSLRANVAKLLPCGNFASRVQRLVLLWKLQRLLLAGPVTELRRHYYVPSRLLALNKNIVFVLLNYESNMTHAPTAWSKENPPLSGGADFGDCRNVDYLCWFVYTGIEIDSCQRKPLKLNKLTWMALILFWNF